MVAHWLGLTNLTVFMPGNTAEILRVSRMCGVRAEIGYGGCATEGN